MTNPQPHNDAFLPSEMPPLPDEQAESSPKRTGKKITRRRFLKYSALAAGAAAATAGVIDATVIEPHGFRVTHHTFRLPGLGDGWDGAKIAQITDVHVGRWSDFDDARRVVEMTNDLNPDVVALTGDYVSRASAITSALVEVFRDLRAKEKYAVLGNHDYWADAPRVAAALESAGIPLLTNKHVLLRRGGDLLCLAGVNDVWSINPPPDATAALAGAPENVPRIVMSHNPDYAEVAPRDVKIDLMLAGHTHGGQVRLPLLGPLILPIQHRKYAEGWVQGPTCPVFISRGLGMVTVPIRFNCPPELPLITLRKA
ncbi:MAG: metallophosphoesterase [Phycisphaerae bacterium]|nr:metallophosphoesterase [Phycisphaerae bacterium]